MTFPRVKEFTNKPRNKKYNNNTKNVYFTHALNWGKVLIG